MTPREVHRLWRNGDTTSKEFFLIENRERAGFDGSLPGAGLLGRLHRKLDSFDLGLHCPPHTIWHFDDAMTNNRDEKYFWVGLMQADGLNQLPTANGGRGDDGDPFPWKS